VKDLQAMDDYEKSLEQQAQMETDNRTKAIRRDYILDKWKYSTIQKWFRSLTVPSHYQFDLDKALDMMKVLRYTGQEFVKLDKQLLMEMKVSEAAAVWLMDSIEKLYENSSYLIKV
jgi:hypothetical protein